MRRFLWLLLDPIRRFIEHIDRIERGNMPASGYPPDDYDAYWEYVNQAGPAEDDG